MIPRAVFRGLLCGAFFVLAFLSGLMGTLDAPAQQLAYAFLLGAAAGLVAFPELALREPTPGRAAVLALATGVLAYVALVAAFFETWYTAGALQTSPRVALVAMSQAPQSPWDYGGFLILALMLSWNAFLRARAIPFPAQVVAGLVLGWIATRSMTHDLERVRVFLGLAPAPHVWIAELPYPVAILVGGPFAPGGLFLDLRVVRDARPEWAFVLFAGWLPVASRLADAAAARLRGPEPE